MNAPYSDSDSDSDSNSDAQRQQLKQSPNFISFQRFLQIVYVVLVPIRVHELLVFPDSLLLGDVEMRVHSHGPILGYPVAYGVSYSPVAKGG